MNKILGTILVAVFAGMPIFAMANPCIYGNTDYDTGTCYATGGTPGTFQSPTTGGSLGGSATNPTTGGSLGGTSAPLSADAKLVNPIKVNSFSEFAALVTKTAVQILMPFIVLAFIYSGFLFVKAQGNDEGLTEAKKVLWYSMIGAFILLGAWGFAQIIGQTVSTITQ